MATALETIVGEADIKHQMLRDIAMQRLYELDSDAAKPYILEEIRHPHVDNNMGTVKARTLGVLSQETLPEFDDLLVARLERRDSHTMPLDAQLIARYSTKAILPRVKSLYEAAPGPLGLRDRGWLCSLFSPHRTGVRGAAPGSRSQFLHDRIDPGGHEDEALGRD